MIDFHTHTTFSDGGLNPSELARRALMTGYRGLCITDHCDMSNLDLLLENIPKACRVINKNTKLRTIPGIELTHVPPGAITEITDEAREKGVGIILVHGETIAEPVEPGTNAAA
ncbi:MAG: histidinol phosphate phosphatase domain-containing protein, partial [Fibrobacterota bacterium]